MGYWFTENRDLSRDEAIDQSITLYFGGIIDSGKGDSQDSRAALENENVNKISTDENETR